MKPISDDPVIIASAIRTPIGHFQGSLKDVTAPELGAIVIKEAVTQAKLPPDSVTAVIMGCVLPAGQGQAPARQAALKAGFGVDVDCTTINKMCGSGMKAVMLAADIIKTHPEDIMIAGGMESMSNAPYLLPKARQGYRLGHQQIIDHLLLDGLEDAYEKGNLMGVFAERCAQNYHFSREQQDKYTLNSLEKAKSATQSGVFSSEITPVQLKSLKGESIEITVDDGPQQARPEKIPLLRPAFKENGTVTAANSSSISDGAAALTLMKLSKAKELGIKPLAQIVDYTTYSQEPALFTTAPVYAIKKLLDKLQWSVADVDLWEINEAFAVVAMAAIQELSLLPEKVNVYGGGCVLGHPIGASGARIIVTLINALRQKQCKKGIAALCIGGGEATAIAVEVL